MASTTLRCSEAFTLGAELSWQIPNRAVRVRFSPTAIACDATEVGALRGLLREPVRGSLDDVLAVGWLEGVATCAGEATPWSAVAVLCDGELVVELDTPLTLTGITMPETVRLTAIGPAVDTDAEAPQLCLGCRSACSGSLCPGCLAGCEAFDVGGQETRRLSVDELGRLR